MTILVLGLLLFLGVHSIRIVADGWRGAQVARLGEKPWKGMVSVGSLAGFVLIVWGFGLARANPIQVWDPPTWTRLVTVLLTLPAFVLIAAAYVPANHLKAALGHPMVLGVKTWAFAHLCSNGRLDAMLLFGAFLVWAVFSFRAGRRRDRAAATSYPAGTLKGDAIAVVAGVVIWAAFGRFLHAWLIGMSPMG
jgi:uncharacterized membrane protein